MCAVSHPIPKIPNTVCEKLLTYVRGKCEVDVFEALRLIKYFNSQQSVKSVGQKALKPLSTFFINYRLTAVHPIGAHLYLYWRFTCTSRYRVFVRYQPVISGVHYNPGVCPLLFSSGHLIRMCQLLLKCK